MSVPLCFPIWLCLAALLVAGSAQNSSLYIAEFMANNRDTLLDEDADSSDWIELHHRGETTIDLLGYTLSDDPAVPEKWTFPSLVLEPNGRLVVFASGKDRRNPETPLHTNFALDADGEYLALRDPSGEVLSVWESFPPQGEDESYGLGSAITSTVVIDTDATCTWLVPFGDRQNLEWTVLDFDDRLWNRGYSGIGYDFGLDYHQWIHTDVGFDMAGFATSAQIRFPFVVDDIQSLLEIVLHLRVDDGFVAFLNGTQVASFNAPATLRTTSAATADHTPSDAIKERRIDLSAHRTLLQEGENLLAIQGLDESATSGDFLIHPRLELRYPVEVPSYGILPEPTPGEPNGESYAGRVAPVVFGALDRFLNAPGSLTMTTETAGATIHFTFSGDTPTLASLTYEDPVTVSETVVVRARAYRPGLLPSPVTSHTYVVLDELLGQSLLNQSALGPDSESLRDAVQSHLPILSIAVDYESMFGDGGLDTIPDQSREVPVSMELFGGDLTEELHIDAGLGIHGGNARTHPKKPYRLFFRREYGEARLTYPLFDDSPVASFDQLILRAGGHDSWSPSPDFGATSFDLPYHASYLRDPFLRKTETEMGLVSPRGRYVQVLLNGFYWGVYDLHERPNATFFSDHVGGPEKDWEVVHHADTLDTEWETIDGDGTLWQDVHDRVSAGIATPEAYAQLQTQVDIDRLIDALLVRMWSGDFDWLGPVYWQSDEATFFRNKNWYAAQRGGEMPEPLHFFTWDAEMSMGAHLLDSVFGAGLIDQQVLDFDLTQVNDPGTPGAVHDALRYLPNYRRRFGDRAQRLFFQGGPLDTPVAQARLDAMVADLSPLMDIEAARWGDFHRIGPIFTKDTHWLPEIAWLRERFLTQRNTLFLNQLRARGLFPDVDGVLMEPRGGSLDQLSAIRLNAAAGGTIYFTTDGSDPATTVEFRRQALITATTPGHYIIPTTANGGEALSVDWNALTDPTSLGSWTPGSAGIGYETGEVLYANYFETDVSDAIQRNTTIYVRIPFEANTPEVIEKLVLKVRYDDGFAAFLNGEPLVSHNAPDMLSWQSTATTRRFDDDAIHFRDFDVSDAIDLLQPGRNILAIQALNGALASSDILMVPELIAIETDGPSVPASAAQAYNQPLRFTEATTLKARVLAANGEWSALTEGSFYPGALPSPDNLAISEIHYHPLDSESLDGTAYEFIEITNHGSTPALLTGMRFSEGITFTFPDRLLPAGESVLVVNDRDAFLSRYGEALTAQVIGTYGETSRLSNGGELLTLVDRDGRVLDRVAYEDSDSWPAAADGEGGSLERLRLDGPSDAHNWRVSVDAGGTPGSAQSVTGYAAWLAQHFGETQVSGNPLADPDGDGHVNLIEYLAGSDPDLTDAGLIWEMERTQDAFVIRHPRLNTATDVLVTIEHSSDLDAWTPLALEPTLSDSVNARQTASYTLPKIEKGWYRLRAALKE